MAREYRRQRILVALSKWVTASVQPQTTIVVVEVAPLRRKLGGESDLHCGLFRAVQPGNRFPELLLPHVTAKRECVDLVPY